MVIYFHYDIYIYNMMVIYFHYEQLYFTPVEILVVYPLAWRYMTLMYAI